MSIAIRFGEKGRGEAATCSDSRQHSLQSVSALENRQTATAVMVHAKAVQSNHARRPSSWMDDNSRGLTSGDVTLHVGGGAAKYCIFLYFQWSTSEQIDQSRNFGIFRRKTFIVVLPFLNGLEYWNGDGQLSSTLNVATSCTNW